MTARSGVRAAYAALLGAALLAGTAAPLGAQRVVSRFGAEPEQSAESPAIEIAKWSTGALAAGAVVSAFLIQGDAEDRYAELERFCRASPDACRELTPDGAYADPALEGRYQGIRDDYRTARLLLIGGQALALGSALLFILDLPRDPQPENVPYEPPELRVGVRPDGALEAGFRYPVSNILTRSP